MGNSALSGKEQDERAFLGCQECIQEHDSEHGIKFTTLHSFFEPQSKQTAWLIFSPEEKELNGRNLSRTPSSMWKDCETTLGISSSPPKSLSWCNEMCSFSLIPPFVPASSNFSEFVQLGLTHGLTRGKKSEEGFFCIGPPTTSLQFDGGVVKGMEEGLRLILAGY
jgi:hypothetical protein